MSDTTKIPFSFCRIKRAADFLGVYVDDLLSLAVSGKITMCVRLDGLKSIIYIDGNPKNLDDWYLSLIGNDSVLAFAKNLSTYSSFAIDNLSYDEENDDSVFHPRFYQTKSADGSDLGNQSQSHAGRAFGLWIPQTPVINGVLNYGAASISWGSLGLYRTDEETPALCLIPSPLNHENNFETEEDDDDYEEKYPDVNITVNDLWITAEQVRELIKHNGDFSELPNSTRCGGSHLPDLMNDIKKVNHAAEHHATNREKLFKAAIYLLSKYPDECRGERKEISPEKWRDCIQAHRNEIPPLFLTNEEVILKHLRSAANGKG